MMLKSLEQYFSTTVSTDGILFASLSSGAWQFFSTNISQGSVAARLGCGGYWIVALPEIYGLACWWKNFENHLEHLVKLEASGTFFQTGLLSPTYQDLNKSRDIKADVTWACDNRPRSVLRPLTWRVTVTLLKTMRQHHLRLPPCQVSIVLLVMTRGWLWPWHGHVTCPVTEFYEWTPVLHTTVFCSKNVCVLHRIRDIITTLAVYMTL